MSDEESDKGSEVRWRRPKAKYSNRTRYRKVHIRKLAFADALYPKHQG
ncbi:MAG: hypothetical protein ACE5J5_02380 [Candidatus Hydrothermarchaeales archaeon]